MQLLETREEPPTRVKRQLNATRGRRVSDPSPSEPAEVLCRHSSIGAAYLVVFGVALGTRRCYAGGRRQLLHCVLIGAVRR